VLVLEVIQQLVEGNLGFLAAPRTLWRDAVSDRLTVLADGQGFQVVYKILLSFRLGTGRQVIHHHTNRFGRPKPPLFRSGSDYRAHVVRIQPGGMRVLGN
jgi:hypothetical protein